MMKTRFQITLRGFAICLCAGAISDGTHRDANAQSAQLSPPAQTSSSSSELQQELNDFDLDSAWVYNDWATARDQAAREGKPIFALFR